MKKILLIEDDHDICEVISDYFNTKGTAVDTISDGGYALDIIKNGLEQYGLVLLELCFRMLTDLPYAEVYAVTVIYLLYS